MIESKLSPGHWPYHFTGEHGCVWFYDAEGRWVVAYVCDADGEDSYVRLSPRVLAALDLLEAARRACELSKNPANPYEAWKVLREALALVDGEDRADGVAEIWP